MDNKNNNNKWYAAVTIGAVSLVALVALAVYATSGETEAEPEINEKAETSFTDRIATTQASQESEEVKEERKIEETK